MAKKLLAKYQNGNYECIEEFITDVKLIFSNAMKYNPPRNTIHIFANTLSKFFDDKMKEIYQATLVYHRGKDQLEESINHSNS